MKISSSALSAIESTLPTEPSVKSSHEHLYVQPTSASHPSKEFVDNDDDSGLHSNGTQNSDAESSIAAVLEMRAPPDTVKNVDVVAQRDGYHCLPGSPSGYDIEEHFQATSFLCGIGDQEWRSSQCADYTNCRNSDERLHVANAAYDFTASAPKEKPCSIKINEKTTCKDDDENCSRYIEPQSEITKETPGSMKINENSRSVPLYTPYIESQFEAICATSKRPFHFVAIRAIKALNRDVFIPVTINEPGPLGLIVKDNSDGVVCVVDVSPSAMEACKILHPGDILAYPENIKKEIIPEIEVVFKNMNPAKAAVKLPPRNSLCDKLEVRVSTDTALPNSTNADKLNFLGGILAIFEKINRDIADLSFCSLAQFDNYLSISYKPTCTDEPSESLNVIPSIEPINPDVLLESTSSLQNPDEAQEERLDERQEETTEDQTQKSRILASRVISSDADLPNIEDEYLNILFSSDDANLPSVEDEYFAVNGIIPLLKNTGAERLADDLAEDIVSSIEAADIDAILDTVVEHLVFIFDKIIPDGEDDEDEEHDSELPRNPKIGADRGLVRNVPWKGMAAGKYSSSTDSIATKDRKGTKFLRKVRRYRLLLHKRLNRSTVLCSGGNRALDADSFGEESSDSDSDSSVFTSAETRSVLNLGIPEFGRYAEQGVARLQKFQKAGTLQLQNKLGQAVEGMASHAGTLQLQNRLGKAMEGMASHVQSDSGQKNGQIKPAQTSSEELAKAWRNGCEKALQQMNEEETAYLTAYTAATGTSALTAVSELALLSTVVNKNASRTYNINNSSGAIDTVAGNIRDGDGGIGVLASKYVTRAQKDKERAARMEAMARALAVERKNRTAKKSRRSKEGKVRFEELKADAVSSGNGASSKYSASVSKGIKKSSRARKNHRGGTIV